VLNKVMQYKCATQGTSQIIMKPATKHLFSA